VGIHDETSGLEFRGAAEALRPISARVQRGATTRGARYEDAIEPADQIREVLRRQRL